MFEKVEMSLKGYLESLATPCFREESSRTYFQWHGIWWMVCYSTPCTLHRTRDPCTSNVKICRRVSELWTIPSLQLTVNPEIVRSFEMPSHQTQWRLREATTTFIDKWLWLYLWYRLSGKFVTQKQLQPLLKDACQQRLLGLWIQILDLSNPKICPTKSSSD